jgi:hypothetical protein
MVSRPARRKINAPKAVPDRHIVQQKGHRPPEDRIVYPREPHRQRHGDTHRRVHDRYRDQIHGDVAFDLLRDFNDLALAAEARQYLDEAVQEDIAGHEEKKRNSTVVKKPLAKLRVPVNSLVRRVGPRAEPAAFGDGPVSPKSSTCCKNRCSVSMGSRMKLSRSCSRGMPSGSLAAQVAAGPEMAVPKPTIVPNSARISSSASEDPRYVQPLQYARGRLQQELENEGKDQWQHDLARDIGCRQERKDE